MEAIREEGITQPTMVFSICKCNDGWYGTECENSFDEVTIKIFIKNQLFFQKKQASKGNTVPPTEAPTEKQTQPREQTTAPTVRKTTPKTYMRPRSSRKRPYFASPKRKPSMSGSNNKSSYSSRRQSSSPRQGNNAQPTEAPTKKQAKPQDQTTAPTVRRSTPKAQYSNPRLIRKRPYFASPKRTPPMSGSNDKSSPSGGQSYSRSRGSNAPKGLHRRVIYRDGKIVGEHYAKEKLGSSPA